MPENEEARRPKNIVVFSDGTSADGGRGSNTNVYRLFNMAEDRTDKQITFYDQGVGTGLRRFTGAAFGRGFTHNILECYRFIFDHYESGDRVYLFGFSRGAATVRSLAGFINMFGILPKSRPELIREAYKIYEKKDSKEEKLAAEERRAATSVPPDLAVERQSKKGPSLRKQLAEASLEGGLDGRPMSKRQRLARAFILRNHTMSCEIRFLGVWDTVAALGIPIRLVDIAIDTIWHHNFHDFTLSANVEHACQALAIDDERKYFLPIVWDEPAPDQTMKQVWFCGMHSDVGGGGELADIPLAWMAAEAEKSGLLIWPHHEVPPLTYNPDGEMGDSRGGTFSRFYPKQIRSWDTGRRGRPAVHQSVKARTRNRHNEPGTKYDPWILNMKDEPKVEPWPPEQPGTVKITSSEPAPTVR